MNFVGYIHIRVLIKLHINPVLINAHNECHHHVLYTHCGIIDVLPMNNNSIISMITVMVLRVSELIKLTVDKFYCHTFGLYKPSWAAYGSLHDNTGDIWKF